MPADKASMIACILYTVRDYAETPAAIVRTFKRLRKIGYKNVQVSGGPYVNTDPAELRKMADDTGLSLIGSHIGWPVFESDPDKAVAMSNAWGAHYAAIPSWRPTEDESPAKAWRSFAAKCNKIGEKLKASGIQLQYHNHAFEFEKLNIRNGRGGRFPHSILMDGTQPANLQPELDIGWVARAGLDPAEYIDLFKGRLDQVHVKDWGVDKGQEPIWRAIGEGNLNWPTIIRRCKAAKVKMYIVEQDSCPVTNDPFKSLTISFEKLMELL